MSVEPKKKFFAFRSKSGWTGKAPSRLLAALLCLAVFVILRLLNPLPFERLRDSSIGFLIETSSNFLDDDAPASIPDTVIVDIDDLTVNSYGKWPLPRSEITRMMQAINQAKPAVIGCACVFLGESEGTDAAFDRALADSFRDGNVVLGIAEQRTTLTRGATQNAGRIGRPVVSFDNPDEIHDVPEFASITPVSPLFSRAAGGVGFLALQLSHEGIPRRLPTVVLNGNRLIPSLPLEMLRIGENADGVAVHSGEYGVQSVIVGKRTISTDSNGVVWFRVDSDKPVERFSAGDIMTGRADLSSMAGKYVLIGSTATGLSSDYVSPDGSLLPGLDALAFSLKALIENTTLNYPPSSLLYEILIGLGVISLAFISDKFMRAPAFISLGIAVFLALWGLPLAYLHVTHRIVDPGLSMLALALVYTGLLYERFQQARTAARVEISEKDQQVTDLRQESAQAVMAAANPRLSAVLTHELRQPLAAAQNYLGAIKRLSNSDQAPQNEKLVAYATEASRQIASMSEIMQEMADIVRGEFTMNLESDVGAIVADATTATVSAKKEDDIIVVDAIAENLPVVTVNRRQLEQLVSNLVRNAIEAPRNQTALTITVGARVLDHEWIEVSIADNAAGIPEADREKIFNRYVSSKPGGSGIGLALCRTIADAHGGKLWLTSSTKPGASGTTFRFTLRRAA
jgi:signal transduction histidine kinase